MKIIVGLGNPGTKYKKTRHNIGFRVIEQFGEKNNFPGFQFLKKFNAEISEGILDNQKIILAKPQTFMNLSGKEAKLLLGFYKVKTDSLWVIHDDIDLPLGKIRISKDRGAAGHKGVKSIIRAINSKNFVRFRIGIESQELGVKNTEKFVLEKFSKKEEEIVKGVIKRTCSAIEMALKDYNPPLAGSRKRAPSLEKAMTKFNK